MFPMLCRHAVELVRRDPHLKPHLSVLDQLQAGSDRGLPRGEDFQCHEALSQNVEQRLVLPLRALRKSRSNRPHLLQSSHRQIGRSALHHVRELFGFITFGIQFLQLL